MKKYLKNKKTILLLALIFIFIFTILIYILNTNDSEDFSQFGDSSEVNNDYNSYLDGELLTIDINGYSKYIGKSLSEFSSYYGSTPSLEEERQNGELKIYKYLSGTSVITNDRDFILMVSEKLKNEDDRTNASELDSILNRYLAYIKLSKNYGTAFSVKIYPSLGIGVIDHNVDKEREEILYFEPTNKLYIDNTWGLFFDEYSEDSIHTEVDLKPNEVEDYYKEKLLDPNIDKL